ncbi:MAG: HD domain-containing protein [Gammaproteobacteria bacterium]|nr:HD domain-containing protein [Gammaproteobacteria bacterium]
MSDHQQLEQLERLTEIGIALSAEKNTPRLLEMILLGAKAISNADGGTLYSVTEDNHIKMEIVRTDSLNFAMGGTTGKKIPFPAIPIYDEDGLPNSHMVVCNAVLNDCTLNIPDAYNTEGFDFSGTKKFDNNTGYRSQSFLTVPMKNHEGDIIGVLQLLNATDARTGEVIPFSQESQRLTESLASLAAIALTNRRLIDDLKRLLESLIQLIATAIDEKSPYTAGHCERVPILTMMIADAANACNEGPFAKFHMSDDDFYELRIAAWLHDCGKITTPEHVVDKATKLQTIFDRVEMVETRFDVLKHQARIALLEERLRIIESAASDAEKAAAVAVSEATYEKAIADLDDDLAFIIKTNSGGEFMHQADQERIRIIGQRQLHLASGSRSLLNDDEIYNLTISKGTLTPEEREIINNHIVATIKMLESLPFPKHLSHVPEYAGGHHERMDGKGYPKGLTGEQMSLQARFMAVADVFEALTAVDRPYKDGKTLTESLKILGFMKKENHIDPDVFDLFIRQRIYLKYAEANMSAKQIDNVDHSKIPGYIE